LFVNHHGRLISESGIQYRLKQHCQAAGVSFSCHQLRHTYARRLVENGLPVDSLARLLGHSQLQTTQRYIDGADPTLRADFSNAMAGLEQNFIRDQTPPPEPPQPKPPRRSRRAPQAELVKLRQRLVDLPPWLADAVDAYLSWRWPTWRAQTAIQLGRDTISLIRRLWTWLDQHRQVNSWESFRRTDLEAWLDACAQQDVSKVTLRNNLAQVRSVLKFLLHSGEN
jgi:site-specific recombinase XerD